MNVLAHGRENTGTEAKTERGESRQRKYKMLKSASRINIRQEANASVNRLWQIHKTLHYLIEL